VLPYPHIRSDVFKAALCLREKAVVRKKPECWTCSWCVTGSDTMASVALEARQCKIVPMTVARKQQDSTDIIRRAA
jgi:hypothetical protein